MALLESRGRVLSRQSLLEGVWGYSYAEGTRTVDVHVRRLREKIPALAPVHPHGEVPRLSPVGGGRRVSAPLGTARPDRGHRRWRPRPRRSSRSCSSWARVSGRTPSSTREASCWPTRGSWRAWSRSPSPAASTSAELDALVDEAARDVRARVTVILPDGRVVADSANSGDALAAEENHAGRPEVVEALASGTGGALRHSVTVDQDLLYAAVADPPPGTTSWASPASRSPWRGSRARSRTCGGRSSSRWRSLSR